MRSKLFILLSLVFLCLIFASGGCGGGGDSGDGNNGWVTIEYPTVEKEYTISTDAINLRGEVFYFGGKCCQGSAEQLTGVTVTWNNETTGRFGKAGQTVEFAAMWPGFAAIDKHTWGATIPLSKGEKPRYQPGVTHKRGRGTSKQWILIAVERQGSVRSQPVVNDSINNLSPVVKQFVQSDAHLMTDQHMSFRKIAKNYAGYSTVNHLRKEYCIGDTHTNTAESFGAMLERTKLGVFHYMSNKHLSRYLNEIDFRWDHRIPEIKITKNGKKKKYMRPMPFMARLVSLLSRCAGRQVRRTHNYSVKSIDNLQPYCCL